MTSRRSRPGRAAVALLAALMAAPVVTAPLAPGSVVRAAPTVVGIEDGDLGADVGNFVESVPRSKRVAVFSDSVGLGARTQIPAAFPPDWEVNVDGQPARFVKQMESQYVRPRMASSPQWFGDHVVIAAGYNAPLVSSSQMDAAEFDRQLDSMMATLTAAGVKHVHWVTLREVDPQYISAGAWRQIQPYYWYFPQVNDRLEAALTRHPNLTLVDWAAQSNRAGLTYDAIHLNPTGAQLYAELIRDSVYSSATRVADGSTTKIHVPGGEGAAAATVNLTTTHPRRSGHLTVHRCDQPAPNASVHNFVRAQTVAHAAIAPLDGNGDFCVTTHTATNLIVDITGLLRSGAGFTATRPTRWRDTRATGKVAGGSTLVLDVDDVRAAAGFDANPKALAIIVTAVQGAGLGHVTVSSCDPAADHSNLNFTGGDPTPNLVFVEPTADGRICLFAKTTTHLVVDLMGVFDETAAIAVGAPERLRDTRREGAKVGAGQTVRVAAGDAIDPAATGAIVNLTGVLPDAAGHFTAYPCTDGLPNASNLNLAPGAVVANAVVLAPDAAGEFCVSSHSSAHMIIDLLGWIGDSFSGLRPVRVLDTRRG